jgi:hypothetical protein
MKKNFPTLEVKLYITTSKTQLVLLSVDKKSILPLQESTGLIGIKRISYKLSGTPNYQLMVWFVFTINNVCVLPWNGFIHLSTGYLSL